MMQARLDGVPVAVDSLGPSPSGLLWLHAVGATSEEVDWLADRFAIHPLAVEDIRLSNQRPKYDDYESHIFVVVFAGVAGTDGLQLDLVEVHLLVGDGYVVSVCDHEVPAITALAEQVDRRPEVGQGRPDRLFHRICDVAVDSLFPVLDSIDATLDSVETRILERADRSSLNDVFTLKRELNLLRRVLGPQRDLLQALTGPRSERIGPEAQLYLRDVYDHAVRIVEELDSFRDTVTSALDVYLSSVSNRLGEQTRRLTVVATIFLPLTFLTGFFGMNFGALVATIATPFALLVGLTIMAASVPTVLLIVHIATARATAGAAPPRQRSLRRLADLALRQAGGVPHPATGGGTDPGGADS